MPQVLVLSVSHLVLVSKICDKAVGMIVLTLVEGSVESKVIPVSISLVSHVVCNPKESKRNHCIYSHVTTPLVLLALFVSHCLVANIGLSVTSDFCFI